MSQNRQLAFTATPQLRARIEQHRNVLAGQLGIRLTISETICSLLEGALPPARTAK